MIVKLRQAAPALFCECASVQGPEGLHTIFPCEIRLGQGEFLAVATHESEKVSVLLSLCFEHICISAQLEHIA